MLRHVVALVAGGGGSGLGAATASLLVRNGARVVVGDIAPESDSTPKKADDDTHRVVTTMNVTNESQVTAALDLAQDCFGEPVNVAVNCAGIALAQRTLARRKAVDDQVMRVHSLDDFAKSMEVNVVGTFNVVRLAAQRMAQHDRGGCIINTASVAAFDGQRGQAAYAASKGAVAAMTLPLARDLSSHGIRVMTIAPGIFETPMMNGLPPKAKESLEALVPFPKRLGYPEEFAQLVQSIILNPMLNGEVIRLDGALRMPP